MGTKLLDDGLSDRPDQLITRVNLRLVWRLWCSDFLHGLLTLAPYSQRQAMYLRVFGPRRQEAIAKEEPWHVNRP